MKKENKELVADILFRELENEFHYDEKSIHYIVLKQAYVDFIKKHFSGIERYGYVIDLKDLEKANKSIDI